MSERELQSSENQTQTLYKEKEQPIDLSELSPEQIKEVAKMLEEKKKAEYLEQEKQLSQQVQIGQEELRSLTEKPVGKSFQEELESLEITPKERERIEALKSNINVQDAMNVTKFGLGVQQQLGNFSDKLLENVSTKDSGEVGKILDDLLSNLNTVDVKDLNKKEGFFRKIFRKASQKTSELLNQYQSVAVKVDKTANKLRDIQVGLQDDVRTLTKMAEQNMQYGKAVRLYIIAGEEKIKDLRENELPKMQEIASSGDMEAQQALQRLTQDINRLEKRVFDLQTSKTITLQSAPQIDLIRNTSVELVEKIESSINTVIPLWKNQITIALTLRNQANAQKAQEAITNATNSLLLKNSEMLKQNTIDIAKQAERGIVDVATLEQTQKNLVETIEETMRIQQEGSIAREKAKQRMQEMEQELKQSLARLADEALQANQKSLDAIDNRKLVQNNGNSNDYLNL